MTKFRRILFIAILFELMLGGGGRLISVGPLSLRMILFAIAMACSVFLLLKGEKLSRGYWKFLFLFMGMLSLGLLLGIVSGNNRALWWEDIKPLLYVLILPFFALTITSQQDVEFVGRAIKICAVVMGSLFMFVLLLIHTSTIPFLTFYNAVLPTQEFFFRGEFTFFYKGFVFLAVGFIFYYSTPSTKKVWVLLFLFTAIVLAITRGLFLGLFLTLASYYYFYRSSIPKTVFFVCLSVGIIFGGQYIISQGSELVFNQSSDEPSSSHAVLLGDREYSDQGRWQQIKDVTSSLTPISIFIGHGFGQGVPSRPVHMEISYLEILHKQGLIGLSVWGYLLWMLVVRWNKEDREDKLNNAFFFGSLFIFFQSLTNQYINNPIGLSWILISLVCLDRLNPAKEFQFNEARYPTLR